MFIVWGSRIKRRKKGFAVDYCPICRSQQAMRVIQLRRAGHIYWVSLFPGKPFAFEATCSLCSAAFIRNLHTYRKFVMEPDVEQAFHECTTPGIEVLLEERTAMEERLHSDSASYSERMDLIREVILDLEYMAEQKAKKGKSESITSVIALLFIVACIGSALCGSGQITCPFVYGWYLSTVSLFVVLVYRAVVTSKRARSLVVMDLLSRGLVPIDPSREELESVLAQARNSKLAKSIQVDYLINQIELEVERVSD